MNVPGLVVGGLALYIWALNAANRYVSAIDYQIKRIKLRLLPPGGTLSIDLKNKNNKGITVTSITGSIVYQGQVISSFATTQPLTLAPGQTVTAEIDFSILVTGVITAIAAVINSGGANALRFTVQGTISAAGLSNIPFSTEVGYELIN